MDDRGFGVGLERAVGVFLRADLLRIGICFTGSKSESDDEKSSSLIERSEDR